MAVKTSGVSRRTALTTLFTATLAGTAKAGFAQSGATAAAGSQDPEDLAWNYLVNNLAVSSGPWTGAFRSAPNGPINWYFANIGLWFFAKHQPDAVRAYLNLYISSLDPVRNIVPDVAADLVTPVNPDSNDAYAGTFLRLAVKYAKASGDTAWWSANVARLKAIAYTNILTQIKPNGLVRVFQAPNANDIGYLMDQCEVYSGLRDFGEYLIETGDPDATYYSAFPVQLGTAIHSLFDASNARWNWCDVPSPASNAWYPNLTAQIYPHLHDVHSTDAPGDYARLHAGYLALDNAVPDWPQRPQDLYPWLVVGYYAAACLNRADLADSMLQMAKKYYLPGMVNTGFFLISEIGYLVGILRASGSTFSAATTCTAS